MKNQKTVLNIGSGRNSIHQDTDFFAGWCEIRADIAQVNPDVVTDIRTLENVSDQSVDAIWASHVIEHCHWHEQPMIMNSFRRVLKSQGFAVIKVPDLGALSDHIQHDLLKPVYHLPNGVGITAIDILYGHRPALDPTCPIYNPAMNHRMGFNFKLLQQLIQQHEFNGVIRRHDFELTAVIWKTSCPEILTNNINF